MLFVDDFDDAALYNADKMAMAIVKGITGIVSSIQPVPNKPSSSNEQDTYQVKLLTNLNIRKSPNGTIVQKGGAKKRNNLHNCRNFRHLGQVKIKRRLDICF